MLHELRYEMLLKLVQLILLLGQQSFISVLLTVKAAMIK